MSADAGDGDACPIVPAHGRMFSIASAVPRQYCPSVEHDGRGETPPSRCLWPLYGFEESVATYNALRSREAILPDLSMLEVE